MNRHTSVVLCLATLAVLATVLIAAPQAGAGEPSRLRQLRGQKRGEAIATEDAAWPLVRRCQDILVARARGDKEAGDLKAAIKTATDAYKDIIAQYDNTEFEARAWQRLVYLYDLADDEKKALEAVDVIAGKFAGTPFVNETYRSVGLTWLQRRHDPAKALEWFEKVHLPLLPPKLGPDATPGARKAAASDREDRLAEYSSTYSKMVKCHIQLGRPEEAVKLFDRIVALWPDQKERLERQLVARVDEVLSGRSYKDVHPALKEWKTSGRKELVPDAEWARTATAPVVTDEERAKALAAKPPVDRLMVFLHRRWDKGPTDKEIAAAVEPVRPQADEAVRTIMDEFNGDGDFVYRHHAVRALGALGTPKARAALLDIAIGNSMADLPTHSQTASRLYVGLVKNKSDARKLLTSKTHGVLVNGLRALAGQTIDAPLMADLERLLAFTDPKEPVSEIAIRQAAARVMAEAPNEDFAKRKVEAIVAAVAKVPAMPKAKEIWWPGYVTHAEAMYHRYAGALAEVRGADGLLVTACKNAPADTLRCLMIARGTRGDATARAGLRVILTDAEAGLFRAWAARAMGPVGTAEDVVLLRKLAVEDPLARDPGGCMRPPPGQEPVKFYPVRQAARAAADEIEKRLAEQLSHNPVKTVPATATDH